MNEDAPYSERRVIVVNKKKKEQGKFHRFFLNPIERMTNTGQAKKERLTA